MEKRSFIGRLIGAAIVIMMTLGLQAQNLLLNPEAENGDTQGWVDPDNAWSASSEITPHSGDYFFWPARQDLDYTEMYQDVDMSSYISDIDAANSWFNLSGWLANWDQYPHDRATLAIEALNASGQQLLYLSRDHRSPVWTEYQLEGQVPPGTRRLRVHLIATRFVGADNDGYFDDLSLTVNSTAPSIYVTVSAANNLTELPVDGTLQLSAETFGSIDDGYIWSSSFEAVAAVDSAGLVTATQAGRFSIQASGKNTGKTGFIELTAYNPEDIIFIRPESGMQWRAGSVQEVTWGVKGSTSSATLYYSITGGSDWIEVAAIDSVASSHFYWTLPDTNATVNNCYLKMDWGTGSAVSSKFAIIPNTTSIRDFNSNGIPTDCVLYPNFPNPFNPTTTIRYRIGEQNRSSRHIVLSVYDTSGKIVTVMENTQQGPGEYQFRFNAAGLASGVYFYKLQNGIYSQTRKMILMR